MSLESKSILARVRKPLALCTLMLTLLAALLVTTDRGAEARPFPHRLPWGEAMAKYKNLENRNPLDLRALGIEYLTMTGQSEAITKILRPRYEKPEKDDSEYVRWVIMKNCYDNLGDSEFADIWKAWASANDQEPLHAWLWKRALQVQGDSVGLEWIREIAKGVDAEGKEWKKMSLFIRAAAFEVLAEQADMEALAIANDMFENDKKLLRADGERALWLGTFSRLFELTAFVDGKDPRWQKLGENLIPEIEEKDTQPKTRIAMIRAFARAFSTESLYIKAEQWKIMLTNRKLGIETGDSPNSGKSDRYAEPKKPPFMGIQGTGTRIAYVIDLSDSMLEPLKREEIEDIKDPKKEGPITGGDRNKDDDDDKKKGKKKKKGDDDADEMPWDEIENRWDAAREALILSLKGLEEEMFFTVILFGSEAEYLKCTRGLVQATESNVKKAISELEREKVGAPEPSTGRPYGSLRGHTNLHGGIRLAYKALEGGQAKDYDYVDEKAIVEGVDTIFILSDGRPTYDDFVKTDEYIEGYHVGDPETGQRSNVVPDTLIYHGPYNQDLYIIDDVKRLNLFNKAEINCIALGEAQDELLRELKEIGNGNFKRFGSGR